MKYLTYLVKVAIFIYSTNSVAALIDVDWKTNGDSLIIKDTETALQWLSLSETADISYNDVVTNLGEDGVYQGFRLATQSEVLQLWNNAGITNTEREWVTDQFVPVKNLVDRLGPTLMVEPGLFTFATHTIGLVEGGPDLSNNERWAMELTYANDDLSTRTSSHHYTWDVSSVNPHYSTYLVQAVPIPAAVWLFYSGFIGLFVVVKRKHCG